LSTPPAALGTNLSQRMPYRAKVGAVARAYREEPFLHTVEKLGDWEEKWVGEWVNKHVCVRE